ncbi:MAG TPA: FAD-dependent oxidoreductase, partial [Acidimicrobiales bacterium]|nr:FAD-dependent oxidoreductase [Acidimicrobiales bacterium]
AGKVNGARVQPLDPRSGRRDADGQAPTIDVKARAVVNATGIWADELRSVDHVTDRHELRPAKGIHLSVARHKVPCDVAAIIPVRQDKRSIFVVPWGEHTYLGTTDTDYEGPLDDPAVTEQDVAYIINAVNGVVDKPISAADVTGTWAGLRPLLAGQPGKHKPSERTADLSRRHRVIGDADGLVTITGGKLTTYRKMAEDTVDALADVLGHKLAPCPTRRLRLRGAEGAASLGKASTEPELQRLAERYGGEAAAVFGLTTEDPALLEPLVPGLPHIAAEAVYAVRYEMAQCLEDVLARRTRAVLFSAEQARIAAPKVAALLGAELDWSEERQEAEVAALGQYLDQELQALGRTDAGERHDSTPGDPVIGVGS